MPMDRQQVIDFYMSPDGGGLSPEAAAAKADAKMKADPSRFAGSAPKPAAKAPPKTAPKVETKAPPPAATVVRKETVAAAPAPNTTAPPARTMVFDEENIVGEPPRSFASQPVRPWDPEWRASASQWASTPGLAVQWAERRAAEERAKAAQSPPRSTPRYKDEEPPAPTQVPYRPTARSFVSTADAAVPMSAPPRAAQYVSGGGGRMSEYARTGPSDARAVLKGMRPDLAADIDAAGDDEVEELYTQYRAAR